MESRSFSSVFREFAFDVVDLVKTELRLAKLRAVHDSRSAERNFGISLFFGVVAWIGLQVLVVAAILALASVLGGNYQLSTLLMGTALFIFGSLSALFSFRKAKESTTRIFRLVPENHGPNNNQKRGSSS